MKSLSELLRLDKTLLLYLLEQNFGVQCSHNTPRYDLINVYRDMEVSRLIDKKRSLGLII